MVITNPYNMSQTLAWIKSYARQYICGQCGSQLITIQLSIWSYAFYVECAGIYNKTLNFDVLYMIAHAEKLKPPL